MAVYNGEDYLIEQLDSLKNQTLTADEIIICDDCSKDNSPNIVNTYIKDNNLQDKWTYINNKHKKEKNDNLKKNKKKNTEK